MLPNSPMDLLIFEIKDGKVEIEVKFLAKKEKLELRNKNGKKVATLQFAMISNKSLIENAKVPAERDENNHKNPKVVPQIQVNKLKEHGYIYVLNWFQDRITLHNRNFGTTTACKLLFELT